MPSLEPGVLHTLIEDLAPVSAHSEGASTAGTERPRRKRGRPLEMAPNEVLKRIRDLSDRGALFRVHLDAPALYARARRLFGTWAAALGAAGLDHRIAVAAARERSLETRRRRRTRTSR